MVVMGGTFDPPTIVHRAILRSAMDLIQADLAMIVPSNDFYDKKAWKSDYDPSLHQDFETRFRFLEMTFPEPHFLLSRIETRFKERVPMVKTLSIIHEEFPDHELYLLLGDDNLVQFHHWKQPQKILELASLIVVEREGDPSQIDRTIKKHPQLDLTAMKIIQSDPETKRISSTRVRQTTLIAELEELVVPKVCDMIVEHHLYQF